MLQFGSESFAFSFASKNIVFPVALYECQNSSFTLEEKRGLRVFENGVMRSYWA